MLKLLSKFVQKIKSSHFIKNVTIVMTGTVLAQSLGFILSPVISRLYSPLDFGLFGSFNSLVRIAVAAVTLEYSQALILPKKNEDAFNLFVFSCICSVLVSVIFMMAFFITPGYFKRLLQAPSSLVLIPLVIAILISGINHSFQAWCVRIKSFKNTSASQIIRSLSSNGIQTGFGFLNGGAPALIWSSIIADLFATFSLAIVVVRNIKQLIAGFSLKQMIKLAKEYRDFPMYSASMQVINALSLGLPVFLLTYYFGLATAGAYAFSMRILSIPMEFVLRALRQVLYQKASDTHNKNQKLLPLYIKITVGLFVIAILPSLIFFIWAPHIFSLVFGSKWITAGEFARSLIIWLLFMFCNSPAVLFARIIRVQRKMFLYDLTLLALRMGTLFIGGRFLSAENTIMAFAIVGAVMNIIFIAIIGFFIAEKEKVSGIHNLIGSVKGNL